MKTSTREAVTASNRNARSTTIDNRSFLNLNLEPRFLLSWERQKLQEPGTSLTIRPQEDNGSRISPTDPTNTWDSQPTSVVTPPRDTTRMPRELQAALQMIITEQLCSPASLSRSLLFFVQHAELCHWQVPDGGSPWSASGSEIQLDWTLAQLNIIVTCQMFLFCKMYKRSKLTDSKIRTDLELCRQCLPWTVSTKKTKGSTSSIGDCSSSSSVKSSSRSSSSFDWKALA